MEGIKIDWEGKELHYSFQKEYDAGYRAAYKVHHGKGFFRVIRDFTNDKFIQDVHHGEKLLPQEFIDRVGVEILIKCRPAGWKPK